MASNRRDFMFFLGIGGATLATLTAAGFVYRAADRGSFADLQTDPPHEPWQEWRERQLPGTESVALAGILAASAFNTQPWLMRLHANAIDLFFNRRSYTVYLDPFERDAHLGLGACIENMVTAAQGLGSPASITLFPDRADSDHIAHLALGSAAPNETPRFHAIANRHTNRAPYAPGLPSAAVMARLNQLSPSGPARLSLFAANSLTGENFAQGTILAAQETMADQAMLSEQFRWFRQTIDQIRTNSDGLSLIATGLSDLQVRAAMALPDITERDYSQFWLTQIRDVQVAQSPLFGLIAVQNANDRAHLIEAGRLLQRLHLEATAQGLAFQAIAQMNWMADREVARGHEPRFVRRLADLSGDLGTMVIGLRLGYPTRPARASARRPLPNALIPLARPLPAASVPPSPTKPSTAPDVPTDGPVSNRPER